MATVKTSMLTYSKVILEKVSFSKRLFWKEYGKFRQQLSEEESIELQSWVRQHLS